MNSNSILRVCCSFKFHNFVLVSDLQPSDQKDRLKRKGGVSPFKSSSIRESTFHALPTPPVKKLSLELRLPENVTSQKVALSSSRTPGKFHGLVFSLLGSLYYFFHYSGRNFESPRQEILQTIIKNEGLISKNITKKVY